MFILVNQLPENPRHFTACYLFKSCLLYHFT